MVVGIGRAAGVDEGKAAVVIEKCRWWSVSGGRCSGGGVSNAVA